MNPSNFLLSTDYPLDKAIYIGSGSVNASASVTTTTTIPHNLGFTPLIVGSWSLSPSFDVSYELMSGTTAADGTVNRYLDAAGDSSNVYISVINSTGAAFTGYYKIFAFETSTSSAITQHTQSEGGTFITNTDYNYMKLYSQGTVTFNYSPTRQTHSVPHPPGYANAILWSSGMAGVPSGSVKRILDTRFYSFGTRSGVYAEMYDGRMDIVAENIPSSPVIVHWRLYADG